MPYTYDYPHPAVTVDVLIFTIHDNELRVLLIRRAMEPYEGRWALPGGFVGMHESLRRAAWRELKDAASSGIPRATGGVWAPEPRPARTGYHGGVLRAGAAFPARDPGSKRCAGCTPVRFG